MGDGPNVTCCRACPTMRMSPLCGGCPRGMRVVASPAGAKVAAGLGFTNVTALDHGQETTIADGKLTIRATAGWGPCGRSHAVLFSMPALGGCAGSARLAGQPRLLCGVVSVLC